jgi:hypothetical protein
VVVEEEIEVEAGPRLGVGGFPANLSRVNWGAVLLYPIWLLVYGLWKWLLALLALPVISALLIAGVDRSTAPEWAPWIVWGVGRVVFFGLIAVLGLRANRLVWEHERRRVLRESDQSVPRPSIPVAQYESSQRKWTWVGLLLLPLLWGQEVWHALTDPATLASRTTLSVLAYFAFLIGLLLYDRLVVRTRRARS